MFLFLSNTAQPVSGGLGLSAAPAAYRTGNTPDWDVSERRLTWETQQMSQALKQELLLHNQLFSYLLWYFGTSPGLK